jgi:uncharacterized protein (UPF0333 family)
MILKNKGQISLDLLFSLIIVILFIISMFSFIEIFEESKDKINLENSLRVSSNTLASTITTSTIMDDTNFEIRREIERINYKNGIIFPQILIDENSITLSHDDINVVSYFAKNDFNIIIDREYLVINND